MIEWILKRRSIRKYKPGPLSEAQLTKILEAAMAAPTANNTQTWEFVVARAPEVRQAIADAHPYGKMAVDAAVVIVVVGDKGYKYADQEAGAATQNILLAATSLGLGAVWLGLRDPEREAGLRAVLAIPDHKIPLVAIPIGLPAEEKPARTQYDPKHIFFDRYGSR